jgi:RNA polymerase sigma-70 factor (ECF subfamily)
VNLGEAVVEQQDEQEWLSQARTGDRQAFAMLAERYWSRVYHWLCGLTRETHSAEDLTQEAFLRAWAALPLLEDTSNFRAWLFRIARNCFLDTRRRGRTTQPLPETLAARDPGPLSALLSQEGQDQLREACARLPTLYRAPFLLWTAENWTYTEIAEVCGVTEETARWRVCKARQLLLKKLSPYLDRPSP